MPGLNCVKHGQLPFDFSHGIVKLTRAEFFGCEVARALNVLHDLVLYRVLLCAAEIRLQERRLRVR